MSRQNSNPPRSLAGKIVTKLRTIYETAEILNVSPRTVRRLIESGDLRAHRIRGLVRIGDADIAVFLAQN
jgi:excisionase family DNA binding protein